MRVRFCDPSPRDAGYHVWESVLRNIMSWNSLKLTSKRVTTWNDHVGLAREYEILKFPAIFPMWLPVDFDGNVKTTEELGRDGNRYCLYQPE